MRLAVLGVLAALLLAGCGGGSAQPKGNPGTFALSVVDRIVHNRYAQVWDDLHTVDQQVAPLAEYVGCESRSPVIAQPKTVQVLSVNDESVGLGGGKFVDSKAVDVRMAFTGGYHLTHTVHVVADHGHWKFILPAWRFRDYKADRCPTAEDNSSTQGA